MSVEAAPLRPPLHLRLPATSANLGPGFDAVGLALTFYLTVDAQTSMEFSIKATGRDTALCGSLSKNLVLDTYAEVLKAADSPVVPLELRLHNEIPLGMGCGSSAAALLAGVLLANHFGGLGLSGHQVMEEAARREGHPDNVAACWFGGMTISADVSTAAGSRIEAASFGEHLDWKLMLALPPASLSTAKARALLPASYSRADAVANIQRTALLVAAFAQGRGELLRSAVEDRLHQPYRAEACPLLPLLLPLVQHPAVLGVALSGAGPSVLLIHKGDSAIVRAAVRERLGGVEAELLDARIAEGTFCAERDPR